MTRTLALAALLAVGACATPPATYSVIKSRAIAKPYDVVWENLVGYFATRSLSLKTIAKDSGIIYAEINRYTPDLADCGDIGPAYAAGGLASVNVFVARVSGDPTVTINTRFIGYWQTVGSVGRPLELPCNSRGILEAEILDVAAR